MWFYARAKKKFVTLASAVASRSMVTHNSMHPHSTLAPFCQIVEFYFLAFAVTARVLIAAEADTYSTSEILLQFFSRLTFFLCYVVVVGRCF